MKRHKYIVCFMHDMTREGGGGGGGGRRGGGGERGIPKIYEQKNGIKIYCSS